MFPINYNFPHFIETYKMYLPIHSYTYVSLFNYINNLTKKKVYFFFQKYLTIVNVFYIIMPSVNAPKVEEDIEINSFILFYSITKYLDIHGCNIFKPHYSLYGSALMCVFHLRTLIIKNLLNLLILSIIRIRSLWSILGILKSNIPEFMKYHSSNTPHMYKM